MIRFVCAALLVCSSGAPGRGQDDFESASKREAGRIIAPLEELAEWAQAKRLFGDCVRTYQLMILLEPDHAKARRVIRWLGVVGPHGGEGRQGSRRSGSTGNRSAHEKELPTPSVKTTSTRRIVMHRPTTLLALMALGLTLAAQNPKQEQPAREYKSAWELISNEHDKNGDGKISAREYSRGKERFERLDRNGDGWIRAEDFVGNNRRRDRGRIQRRRDRRIRRVAPKVGAVAPGFTLKTIDGKKKERLSTYKGKKPVALIFGSYT